MTAFIKPMQRLSKGKNRRVSTAVCQNLEYTMYNTNQTNFEMKAVNFKSFPKHTLVGFFDLEISIGMVLRGCTLHRRDERSWVGLPAKPYEKDGKQSWAAIIDFTSKEIERAFQNAALAAAEVAANG